MIELNFLRAQLVLYPNFVNQTSLSTNHLERGEHIGSKKNALKHDPIDFTVPLIRDASILRDLWAGGLPALGDLPVLDLFSEPKPFESLSAQGSAA
eukprot:4230927-Pleurochrysis_carterae.AAC.1